MIIDATFGLKGRYKAVVRGPDMEVRMDTGWFNNVVTNRGIQEMMSASPGAVINLRAACGSGNSTPAVTDTSLQSFVAGTSTTQQTTVTTRSYEVAPYFIMHSMGWRFGAGVAQGNIAELAVTIGSSTPSASTPIFSRALVRDASGNPTAISVQSDEYLDVYYELYIYPSSSSGSFSQMIDGSPLVFSYSQTPNDMASGGGWPSSSGTAIRGVAASASSSTSVTGAYTTGGSLGGVGDRPTGTYNRIPTATSSAYSASTKSRDLTYTAGLSDANVSFDILELSYGVGSMKMQISPAITKINTKTYTITIRVTLDNTI